MTETDVIKHWQKGAKDALRVAHLAHEDGKNELALFHCHLAIEKALKALYMNQHRKEAPYTHDLVQLALLSQRPWTDEEKKFFADLTGYAVAARYDDPVWAEQEATMEKAGSWIRKTDTLLPSLFL